MANYSVKVIINGIDRATAPIRKISKALSNLAKTQAFNRMTSALGNVRSAMGGVGKEAGLLAARLGGLAAVGGLAFKALFLDTALKFEKFETILTQLEGTSDKAKKAMGWISNFSATTPFELDEVTDSFVKLRAYGMQPQGGLLRSLGDASAAMGKSMMQAVEMIADAVTGENERLKEFGIKARTVGKKIVYEYTQNGKTMTKSALKSSREQIQATIMGIFNSKYAGAMDKLSRTFGGMLSNLSDQWTRLSMMVMSEGLFDFLKGELANLMDSINRLMVDPKFLNELKQFAQDLKTLFVELKTAITEVWPEIRKMISGITQLSRAMGGYQNLLKGLVALMALPFVASLIGAVGAIISAISAIWGFVTAAETAWTMLGLWLGVLEFLTNPILWVVAAIAALIAIGVALQQNWGGISTWFVAMWQKWGGLIRLVAPPIAAIVDLAELIQQNWEPITAFFEALCGTLQEAFNIMGAAIGDVWDGIMEKVQAVGRAIEWVADKLPNVNAITGQQSFAQPALAGGVSAFNFLPSGRPMLNNAGGGSPYVGRTPQKDKLDIAMKIDSEGRPTITKVDKGGNKNMNFLADLGMLYGA